MRAAVDSFFGGAIAAASGSLSEERNMFCWGLVEGGDKVRYCTRVFVSAARVARSILLAPSVLAAVILTSRPPISIPRMAKHDQIITLALP